MKSNIFKNKKYIVYKHTSPSNKVYIGITALDPKYRWLKNGRGYKTQTVFFNAIIKYGWINFKHEILFTDLSEDEATKKERDLILEYKSYDKRFGYNVLVNEYSYVSINCNKKSITPVKTIDPKYETNGLEVLKKAPDGTVLEKYKSVNKAARVFNVPCETLRTRLKKYGRVYYDGFYLETFHKDNFVISMLTLDDYLIKEFSSMADAYKYLGKNKNSGGIHRCLTGERSSYCGYKWKIRYESRNN